MAVTIHLHGHPSVGGFHDFGSFVTLTFRSTDDPANPWNEAVLFMDPEEVYNFYCEMQNAYVKYMASRGFPQEVLEVA